MTRSDILWVTDMALWALQSTIIDEAMADLGYPDANAEITADRSDDVDKIFEKAYESYDNPEYDEIEPDFD